MNLHTTPIQSSCIKPGTYQPENGLEARLRFPHGMIQPEGTFRFSRDALLLANFAYRLVSDSVKYKHIADLGAGCGVVGLAFLLHHAANAASLKMVGIELDEKLCTAATNNAENLGFAIHPDPHYSVICGDIGKKETLLSARNSLRANTISATAQSLLFDAVLCNPPWRCEGTGRLPDQVARRTALFGDANTLSTFFTAADKILRRFGSLFTIAGADRLADAMLALPKRLRPVRICMVHPAQDKDAVFFLLHAIKGSGAALCVEPPLFLDGCTEE